MRRVPRIRQQQLLQVASSCTSVPNLLPGLACRHLTTGTKQSAKWGTTDRIRKALWKGEPPGPEDPYAPSSPQIVQRDDLQDLAEYEADQAALAEETFEVEKDRLARRPARPVSRLIVRRKRTTAPRDDEVDDPGYKPAKTAEGLEEVGGLHDWWEQDGHWGRLNEFSGFPTGQFTDPAVCEVLVRQAVVEVLAVRAQGQEELLTKTWGNADRLGFKRAMAMDIKIADDGSVSLEGDASELLEGLARESKGKETRTFPPEKAAKILESWDDSWKAISLEDARLKFALSKRVYQLTGILLPDAKLAQVQTVRNLVRLVSRPPKPTKLVDVLATKSDLELPNISIFSRRITPIDKETWVGRWKVIEKELKSRDLPVTGHLKLPKAKETDWIRGRV